MTGPPAVVLVLCTAATADASVLADRLLEERLCACVNLLGPLASRYRWQGRIEEAQEMLLLIKTRADLVPTLRARIQALHAYQVPEVLEFSSSGGLDAYLAWVREACRP